MKIFKDANGKSWTISVTTNAITRARDLAHFDLISVAENKGAIEKLSDPVLLVNVLFAVCKPEADAARITDEQFAEGLIGDGLEAAANALLEDLADFFPKHRRAPLKSALEKIRQIQVKAAEMQVKRIESPELEAGIMAALESAVNSPVPEFGNSSGNSPASSA